MRVALLLNYPDLASSGGLSEEAAAAGQAAFDRFAKDLLAAGALLSADMFRPVSASRRVTAVTGETTVAEGPAAPAAPGAETLGGIILIEVADLDAAIDWAGRAPSVGWGTVEVRPVSVRFDVEADRWSPA